MKNRMNAAYIDEAIENIAAADKDYPQQIEEYNRLLTKARGLSYKKGIATLLKLIAAILMRRRQYKEAAPVLDEALKIVKAMPERNELYIQLRLLECEMRSVNGAHNETIAIANELINNYADTMHPDTLVRCYLAAGNGYWLQGLLYNAMYTLQKVLLRRDEFNGLTTFNIVWMTYANVLKDLHLHERARDEMNEILKHARLSPRDAIVMNINLSTLYGGTFNDVESSRKYMDECYRLLESQPFPELKQAAVINWASNLVAMGQYDEALPIITNTEIMRPDEYAARDMAEWKYMVSRCLLETGHVDEALPWLQEAEKLVIETGLIRQKIFIYDSYFLYHSLKGRVAEARKYHQLHKRAMEEENRMTHDLQAKQLDALINLERKEHELQVERLKHQQAEQDANHAHQQNALMQANIEQRNNLIDEFQRAIKRLESSDAKRKEIFNGLNEKISTVRRNSIETAAYDIKFNTAHTGQVQKLQQSYPSITPSEAKIAVMLSSGLTNKEISAITLTTSRNIETQRLNLRKKLKLKPGQDLVKILHGILSKDQQEQQ